jgi:predicted esterase
MLEEGYFSSNRRPRSGKQAAGFIAALIFLAGVAIVAIVLYLKPHSPPPIIKPAEVGLQKKEVAPQTSAESPPQEAVANPSPSLPVPQDTPRPVPNAASPGETKTMTLKLDEGFLASTNIPEKDRKFIPASAQIGIYYPKNFTKGNTYPVFVALQPGTGNFIPGMSAYQRFADELGFLITAQDIDLKADEEAFGRYYYLLATIDCLKREGLLGSEPVVIGGVSGGAKWAMHLGAFGGSMFSGVLAIVANDDFSTYGYQELPNPSAKGVPIYLLNGSQDDIAGPQTDGYKEMLESLQKNGFWNVTAKIFEGGHGIPYEETKQAFERFMKRGG